MAGPTDYDATVTELCERMRVTVVGDAGFWGRRRFLVGGLVPRYLYGPSRAGAQAYVGSRDVDLTVVLMVDYPTPDSYATLERNLLDAGFRQAPFAADPAYRWRKEANAASLILEFIVDTEAVPPGREFAPGARSGPPPDRSPASRHSTSEGRVLSAWTASLS